MPKIRAFLWLIEHQSNIKWNKSWWITVISIGKKAIQDPSMSTLDMKCVPCRIKLHFIETAKVNFNSWLLRTFTFMLYGTEHNVFGNERVHRRPQTHYRQPCGMSHAQWGSNSSLTGDQWMAFHIRRNKEQGEEKRPGESLGEEWGYWWWALEQDPNESWLVCALASREQGAPQEKWGAKSQNG